MYRITFLDKHGEQTDTPPAHFKDYRVGGGGVLELEGIEGMDTRAIRLFAPHAWQSAIIEPVHTSNKEN